VHKKEGNNRSQNQVERMKCRGYAGGDVSCMTKKGKISQQGGTMKRFLSILMGFLFVLGITTSVNADTTVADLGAQIALGEKLYSDETLSAVNNQSCATCHNPDGLNLVGSFVDDRDPGKDLILLGWPEQISPPVSLGSILDPADGVSNQFGGRNTPSAAYAAFSPAFRFDEVTGLYVGGQFWDGREPNLAGQAAGPFRNPV
jgi:cytochrome c peroxidase